MARWAIRSSQRRCGEIRGLSGPGADLTTGCRQRLIGRRNLARCGSLPLAPAQERDRPPSEEENDDPRAADQSDAAAVAREPVAESLNAGLGQFRPDRVSGGLFCARSRRCSRHARRRRSRPLATRTTISRISTPIVRSMIGCGLSSAEQRELIGPRQAFDACLLSARGGAVGHRYRVRELDRKPACRVATRGAGSVAHKSALEIDRPTRIKRAVGAAQQVYPRLGHRPIASPQGGQGPAGAPASARIPRIRGPCGWQRPSCGARPLGGRPGKIAASNVCLESVDTSCAPPTRPP
jgi:hypothetical protein